MATNGTAIDNIGWDHPNIPFAILISLGAGLSTVIGGSFVLCPQVLSKFQESKLLGAALALSAGVMLYVSFIEIFAKSFDAISSTEGISEGGAAAITTAFFFAGMAVCALLELLVQRMGHAHDHGPPATTATSSAEVTTQQVEVQVQVDAEVGKGAAAAEGTLIGNAEEQGRLSQMGLMTALAIGIHNFPEGLATFLATVEDTALGASLGVAIAIHNIPEGYARSTRSRRNGPKAARAHGTHPCLARVMTLTGRATAAARVCCTQAMRGDAHLLRDGLQEQGPLVVLPLGRDRADWRHPRLRVAAARDDRHGLRHYLWCVRHTQTSHATLAAAMPAAMPAATAE